MSVLNDLKIPHMGSVENAKLLGWLVHEGQAFAEGDILYEVETDKTATEVEATDAGIMVRCIADAGSEMKVGDPVGIWAAPGTAAAAIEAALTERDAGNPAQTDDQDAAEPASAQPAIVSPTTGAGNAQQISPRARKLAAEHGVDLAALTGTGPGGRVTSDDILAAAGTSPASAGDGEVEVIPHSRRRQTIARRMTDAAAIPTLTADMEVDLTALFAHRAAEKAAGRSVSILAIIAHAAVAVLRAHKILNAHWSESALSRFEPVHLGMAVETDDGLVVPVIRNAETLDAAGLTAAIARLAERARQGGLDPQDLDGGTFTISNPGAIGPTIRAEALLNPPQIALLGLPGIVREPRAVERNGDWIVEVRPVIRLSLSFDHRAVDGGPVIQFLNQLKERLEQL